mgnify:CR=1 FL=1
MTNIHIIQHNFDSGFRGKYKGYHIDNRLISKPSLVSPILLKLKKYQTTFGLINILTLALELFNTIEYLNKLIEENYQIDNKLKTNPEVAINIFIINAKKEQIVHTMKRIIDDLIMVLCLYYDSNNVQQYNEICISSLGELKTKKKYTIGDKISPQLKLDIKTELSYCKYELILSTINDLHNAYKHSCLISLSHHEFCPTGVSLSAYYAKNGKVNEILYLNHNLMHIVIGFSDFLNEFFDIESTKRKQELLTSEVIGSV